MLKSPIVTMDLRHPSMDEPTLWTPLDNDGACNYCDGQALADTREAIRRLGLACHEVQSSFVTLISSVEVLTNLNPLKRYQLRGVIRELPELKSLYEAFKEIVYASQMEASSASEVLVSYQATILEAPFDSITSLHMKTEIDKMAKFVGTHQDEAHQLEIKFVDLSHDIKRVSAAITRSIMREKVKADRRLISLRQQTIKLSTDVEEYAKSRMAFLGGLRGVGEQCAGIAVASFGAEGDFPDDMTLVEEPPSNAKTGVRHMRIQKRRVKALQALHVVSVARAAEDLGDKAKLVAAIGTIWHNLEMDLVKISTWLSRQSSDDETRTARSPELYGMSVVKIRGLNQELIHQLDRYARIQPFRL